MTWVAFLNLWPLNKSKIIFSSSSSSSFILKWRCCGGELSLTKSKFFWITFPHFLWSNRPISPATLPYTGKICFPLPCRTLEQKRVRVLLLYIRSLYAQILAGRDFILKDVYCGFFSWWILTSVFVNSLSLCSSLVICVVMWSEQRVKPLKPFFWCFRLIIWLNALIATTEVGCRLLLKKDGIVFDEVLPLLYFHYTVFECAFPVLVPRCCLSFCIFFFFLTHYVR